MTLYWKLAALCFFGSVVFFEVVCWRVAFDCWLMGNVVVLFAFFLVFASIAKDDDKENEKKP